MAETKPSALKQWFSRLRSGRSKRASNKISKKPIVRYNQYGNEQGQKLMKKDLDDRL